MKEAEESSDDSTSVDVTGPRDDQQGDVQYSPSTESYEEGEANTDIE